MFGELKYAVNIFACVITQMHVLHTALSVPQTIMMYLQVDTFNLEAVCCETQHFFDCIEHIYWIYRSSDQWYEESIKMDVKIISLCT